MSGYTCYLILLMLAGDVGKRLGRLEAKLPKGEGGPLCSDETGTFLSTELSEGRLEAKPENGDTGSIEDPAYWSRLPIWEKCKLALFAMSEVR